MSENNRVRIVESADVSADATIGDGSSIWHLAQVREGVRMGDNCIVGRGAYIGTGVEMGDNCKVQNYALVYEPAKLGDGVFIGPAVVLTNDTYPRAIALAGDGIDLDLLVTERHPLTEAAKAFRSAAERHGDKVVVAVSSS